MKFSPEPACHPSSTLLVQQNDDAGIASCSCIKLVQNVAGSAGSSALTAQEQKNAKVGVADTACTVYVGQEISPEGAREDAAAKARTPFDNSAASGRTRAAICLQIRRWMILLINPNKTTQKFVDLIPSKTLPVAPGKTEELSVTLRSLVGLLLKDASQERGCTRTCRWYAHTCMQMD